MKSMKKLLLYEKLLVQELPGSSSALLCPCASSLCVCSPMGVGRMKQFGWRLVLAWIVFPWIGRNSSDLHACTGVPSKGADTSLHGQMTCTEPSQETNRTYF